MPEYKFTQKDIEEIEERVRIGKLQDEVFEQYMQQMRDHCAALAEGMTEEELEAFVHNTD